MPSLECFDCVDPIVASIRVVIRLSFHTITLLHPEHSICIINPLIGAINIYYIYINVSSTSPTFVSAAPPEGPPP
jgi:hypothetical protein